MAFCQKKTFNNTGEKHIIHFMVLPIVFFFYFLVLSTKIYLIGEENLSKIYSREVYYDILYD